RGGEKSGVGGDSPHHAGIFVLHFSLNNSVGERLSVCRRRDGGAPRRGWIERGARHCQGPEDFVLGEAVERFVRDPRERCSKDDETDVAIGGLSSGIGHKWCSKGG